MVNRLIVRHEVESILFNLPRWQEMSSAEKVPALIVRDVPLWQAEEIYEGGQFAIGQSCFDRSQRRSFTWEQFRRYQVRFPLPRPGRPVSLYPCP